MNERMSDWKKWTNDWKEVREEGRKEGRRERRKKEGRNSRQRGREDSSSLGSLGSRQPKGVGTREAWLLACCVLVTCTFLAGGAGSGGPLPWSATVTPWLWGPFHFIALILSFPICKLGMASAPRLDGSWGRCCPACWQCPVGRAQAPGPAEGCGNWTWVTCEGGFSRQGAAEGQGAGDPGGCVGPAGCAVLGGAPLTSRACAGGLGRGPVGARSPEIVFPQLSEMCPGAHQPGLLRGRLPSLLESGGPGAGASQPGVCRSGPRIPAPLPWHPQSRFQGLAVFSTVFRCTLCISAESAFALCVVELVLSPPDLPSPAPPAPPAGVGGCLYWRFRPQGRPGSVQSPFSVPDRICALVCCVPVFVSKNEDQRPSGLLDSYLGH
ncbi:uncharacterized protein LOC116747726 [Phocoena sinus]|uniref:uncharacterized protein LOC116747726 n=1 Tax=Phocoena sinus TaxID=42100 RepID=UPI0013C4FF18|nr:uncharacterized protein LOC116747726 [Phocoena sinus]XP_032476151.1 uncharacterized protein LOC116747726 [Phocoena sinus]XP_032476158.1 uncharacterized protein LOC116747726 [Phocoena sinus]XP_032476164.1 uncharacterized protein LOC116747726 [Phocoena sinus]XP_032476171.1 uncharacterized protein LOC116747726 [Phocoena sinus]XP_032476176.1 uncharacterized protein LOC116747726 [Phocoena sinus]XP_032476183.1 uncharacterized protein LOC116747726 [Phocoena sinus]XP_032476192.1 uncharacterized p